MLWTGFGTQVISRVQKFWDKLLLVGSESARCQLPPELKRAVLACQEQLAQGFPVPWSLLPCIMKLDRLQVAWEKLFPKLIMYRSRVLAGKAVPEMPEEFWSAPTDY